MPARPAKRTDPHRTWRPPIVVPATFGFAVAGRAGFNGVDVCPALEAFADAAIDCGDADCCRDRSFLIGRLGNERR